MLHLTATYNNDLWNQSPYDQPESGPAFSRAEISRSFRGGLEGTGQAVLLMCKSNDKDAGYIANERVTGVIDGKKGTFALQHGATMGDHAHEPFGYIVPGSGTGELNGISGTCSWKHTDTESTFELTYTFDK